MALYCPLFTFHTTSLSFHYVPGTTLSARDTLMILSSGSPALTRRLVPSFCIYLFRVVLITRHGASFPGGSGVKNPPSNAGDRGLIPGSGRSPEEMVTHSSTLAWKFSERNLAGYSPWGHKRLRHDLATKQQQSSGIER